MATETRIGAEKHPRWILVLISTSIIVALLAAYAFFATPELFIPSQVTVTGIVTAAGATPNKIIFVNTGCGTKTEAAVSATGAYTATLENEYSYHVTIAYTAQDGAAAEKAAGTLVLNAQDATLTRDWTIQP